MMPTPLPNEGLRAFEAFKMYVEDGPKRSIRRCARRLSKSPTIIARWSKKYRWQKRLRELQLEDCKRAVAADETAKLSVAQEREREQMKFQQRALEASKRATERGLQILQESAKGSKPSDAARLLAVGDAIGRAALGLPGANMQGLTKSGSPLASGNPFIVNVVLESDDTSDYADRMQYEFLAAS
jgi:hypothetical protein